MVKNLPVTAKNVACNLLDRLYAGAINELYLANCPPEETFPLERYLYLHNSDCEYDLRCEKLHLNPYTSCLSRSRFIDCTITITYDSPEECSTTNILDTTK